MSKVTRPFMLISLLFGLVFSFFFGDFVNANYVFPIYQEATTESENLSVYNDSLFDFIAYSPIDSQLEDMEDEPSITRLFPYYTRSATISFGANNFSTFATFSTSNSLEASQFNQQRVLQSSLIQPLNPIYIDTIVANKLDASLGDSISLSLGGVNGSLNFTVSKIMMKDLLYVEGSNINSAYGGIYFPLQGQVKTTIENANPNGLKWRGVMIESANIQNTTSYLSNYIPLGDMLTRDYFDSDVEYNAYVAEFMSRNFESSVVEKEVLRAARLVILGGTGAIENLVDNNLRTVSNLSLIPFIGMLIINLSVGLVLLSGYGKINQATYFRNLLILSVLPHGLIYYGVLLFGYSSFTSLFLAGSSFNNAVLSSYFFPSIYAALSILTLVLIPVIFQIFSKKSPQSLTEPSLDIQVLNLSNSSIKVGYKLSDTSILVQKRIIEAFIGSQLISKNDQTDIVHFTNLLTNTEYTIRLTLSYQTKSSQVLKQIIKTIKAKTKA